jgi:hypothetical protein
MIYGCRTEVLDHYFCSGGNVGAPIIRCEAVGDRLGAIVHLKGTGTKIVFAANARPPLVDDFVIRRVSERPKPWPSCERACQRRTSPCRGQFEPRHAHPR